MQGEDNFNPRCTDKIGPFVSFDTTGWKKTHSFKKVDDFKVTNGVYADGNPPANALGCSAHWFRAHESFNNGGLVAVAFYEHGTRFIKVAANGKLSEAGYFLPYNGSSSSADWVNDKIVYVADYARGIDILRWVGPTYVPKATTPSPGGSGGGGGGGGGNTEQLPGPGVRLRISDRNPDRGDTIQITIGLRKCKGHKGTVVKLQRKVKGDYKPLATKPLKRNCVAKFKDVAAYKKAFYKGVWPKQDKDHRAGKSRPQQVTPQG
jgi:hypothetical protein